MKAIEPLQHEVGHLNLVHHRPGSMQRGMMYALAKVVVFGRSQIISAVCAAVCLAQTHFACATTSAVLCLTQTEMHRAVPCSDQPAILAACANGPMSLLC